MDGAVVHKRLKGNAEISIRQPIASLPCLDRRKETLYRLISHAATGAGRAAVNVGRNEELQSHNFSGPLHCDSLHKCTRVILNKMSPAHSMQHDLNADGGSYAASRQLATNGAALMLDHENVPPSPIIAHDVMVDPMQLLLKRCTPHRSDLPGSSLGIQKWQLMDWGWPETVET